jgi:hypothetical protein
MFVLHQQILSRPFLQYLAQPFVQRSVSCCCIVLPLMLAGLVAQQQCVGPLQIPISDVAVFAQSHQDITGIATSIGEQVRGLLPQDTGSLLHRCTFLHQLSLQHQPHTHGLLAAVGVYLALSGLRLLGVSCVLTVLSCAAPAAAAFSYRLPTHSPSRVCWTLQPWPGWPWVRR